MLRLFARPDKARQPKKSPVVVNVHERASDNMMSVTITFPFLVSWRALQTIRTEFNTNVHVEWTIRPRLRRGAWTSSRVELTLPAHTYKYPVVDILLGALRRISQGRKVVLD